MARNIFQKLYHRDLKKVYRRFSGVILDNTIGDIEDIQCYFENIRKKIKPNTRILVSYHGSSWESILTIASKFGLRRKTGNQNWLETKDIKDLLTLSGFEVITNQKRFFGLTIIIIAKPIYTLLPKTHQLSVSIVIPARNEEKNLNGILSSIPKFGKWQEIIFVEGHSTDNTWRKIKHLSQKQNQTKKVKAFKQKGKGKADAVWLGFNKAKGDILMIYDADRTVEAKDLLKFYNALTLRLGEFANGSRMIYPMEDQAMQTLNRLGNKIFSMLFTWILEQRFKDTLCGTKALFRKDYLYMKKHNKKYFKMDPFGDFALIFGAIKNNLKVIEIPVRYKERVYGKTNISRFRHGLILIRMTLAAFREFKAW